MSISKNCQDSNSTSRSISLSEEQRTQFTEAFGFLNHEREDVRKMAMHGLAAQSKDNKELWLYLSTPLSSTRTCTTCSGNNNDTSSVSGNSRAIEMLLQYLHIGGRSVLGDLLTILVNCSADGTCAEALVHHKIVRKSMRLLDGLHKMYMDYYGNNKHQGSDATQVEAISSTWPLSFICAVQEMTLMLLNNLTANHVSAIDDLLQKDDEDMRGFYLNKLQILYESWTYVDEEPTPFSKLSKDDSCDKDENNRSNAANKANTVGNIKNLGGGEKGTKLNNECQQREEESVEVEQTTQQSEHATRDATSRDLAKWILQILLNLTRSYDGQEMVMDDAQWRLTLHRCMSSPNRLHRLLVAQCYRNCGCSQRPRYDLILQSNALITAVARLGSLDEDEEDVQMCLAEFIACMMESEDGLAKIDGINAKQLINRAIEQSLSKSTLPSSNSAKQSTIANFCNTANCNSGDSENTIVPTAKTTSESTKVVSCELEEKCNKLTLSSHSDIVLKPPVITFLQQHVLPYLDDIVDAYLAPGSDALD